MRTAIRSFTGNDFYLSSFARCVVNLGVWRLPGEDWDYPTNEHAFQAAKSLYLVERYAISKYLRPMDARAYGRNQVTLRPFWEEIKEEVMLELNRQKFAKPGWRDALIDTGSTYLEEGNQHRDREWGTVDGVGENKLGLILMRVREELIREELVTPR